MTDEDIRDFSRLLQLNAARFRLPALPGTWPDWMTPEKRRDMAANFEQYAIEIDAILNMAPPHPDDPDRTPVDSPVTLREENDKAYRAAVDRV